MKGTWQIRAVTSVAVTSLAAATRVQMELNAKLNLCVKKAVRRVTPLRAFNPPVDQLQKRVAAQWFSALKEAEPIARKIVVPTPIAKETTNAVSTDADVPACPLGQRQWILICHQSPLVHQLEEELLQRLLMVRREFQQRREVWQLCDVKLPAIRHRKSTGVEAMKR